MTMEGRSKEPSSRVSHVYIVKKANTRSDGRTLFHCVDTETNEHLEAFLPNRWTKEKTEKFKDLINKSMEKCVIVTNVGYHPGSHEQVARIYMTDSSMLFESNKDFNPTKEKLEEIFSPNTVTLAEARSSPKKRKVTVTAKVTEVGEVISKTSKHGRPYKIRRVQLADANSNITCKLWGEYAEVDIESDAHYKMNCVEVDKSGDYEATIQTTDLTNIERITVQNEVKETVINIIGINEHDEDSLCVLDKNGNVFELPMSVMVNEFETVEKLKMSLPITLKVIINDRVITSIAEEP